MSRTHYSRGECYGNQLQRPVHQGDAATAATTATQPSYNALHSQVDGSINDHSIKNISAQAPLPRNHPRDQRQSHHQHRVRDVTSTQTAPHRQNHIPENAVADLLPYCTTEPPLKQEKVIALSDVVGSLKELVLLALGAAAGDERCVHKLEGAVGNDSASNIVAFFIDEWEVE